MLGMVAYSFNFLYSNIIVIIFHVFSHNKMPGFCKRLDRPRNIEKIGFSRRFG